MSQDKDPASPATTSMAYDIMCSRWHMIETLLGGTEAMRAAGEAYLPKHAEESDLAYSERLDRNVLFNMTEFTLESLVGKPFSEPIKVNEDVPEQIKLLLDDVDLQGNALDVFCRSWFRTGVAKAFAHVLIEFPRPQPRADGRPRTLEDDRRDNLRPYWVQIAPENLIFAHSTIVNGKEVLTHVRIREVEVEMSGFTEVAQEYIRVLEPGLVRRYRKVEGKQGKKDEWQLHEEYATGLKVIPLVTFYTNRQDFMLGKPPLTDLAHLNIAHWQSSSDQRAILTVSRFPMLAVSGGSDEDGKMRIGPNQWLFTPDPQGKFYYVEHEGKAIEAGQKDLESLENQMAGYGAEFLKRKPGNPTATARALDSAEAMSPLQAMVVDFEDAVARALAFTALWLKLDDEKAGTIELVKEYGSQELNKVDLDALDKARQRRDISRLAFISELQRRGVIAEDYDPEADKEEIEQEGVMTGAAGLDLDPAQQNDGGDPNNDPPRQE